MLRTFLEDNNHPTELKKYFGEFAKLLLFLKNGSFFQVCADSRRNISNPHRQGMIKDDLADLEQDILENVHKLAKVDIDMPDNGPPKEPRLKNHRFFSTGISTSQLQHVASSARFPSRYDQ